MIITKQFLEEQYGMSVIEYPYPVMLIAGHPFVAKIFKYDQIWVYEFPEGKDVKINSPIKLNVSKSGGHRIIDSEGISHYIPPKWIQFTGRLILHLCCNNKK